VIRASYREPTDAKHVQRTRNTFNRSRPSLREAQQAAVERRSRDAPTGQGVESQRNSSRRSEMRTFKPDSGAKAVVKVFGPQKRRPPPAGPW
jgi:hypothetical protein